MHLLLIEQPLNNRGDEAAHRGLIHALLTHYPDLTIDILFYGRKQHEIDYFKVASDRVNYLNIPLKSHRFFTIHRILNLIMMLNVPLLLYTLPVVRKVLSVYRRADCIMCAPGGMNLGGFQDWTHTAFLYLAVKTRKPVIYFARSIGPFSEASYLDKQFKKLSLRLLNKFSYISLRDKKSQEMAERMHIKFHSTIDSAFLFVDSANVKLPKTIEANLAGDYIVVVPNSLTWHKDFNDLPYDFVKSFWVELINMLFVCYPNSQIVMLPQTIGYTKILADGFVYFNEIKQMTTNPGRIYVLDEQYGSDIQQAIIKNARCLIGARYHSVIFAINQQIPFVSLSYEHKMTGVLNCLSLQANEVLIKKLLRDIYTSKLSMEEGTQFVIGKLKLGMDSQNKAILAHSIAERALHKLDPILRKQS